MKLAIFDYETTGVDPKVCGVCQASVMDLRSQMVVFSRLALPEAIISEEAAHVHGWTESKLIEAGAGTEAELHGWMIVVLEGYDAIAGYNSHTFDSVILKRHWPDIHPPEKQFDLMRWALRHLMLDGYRLEDVYRYYFNDYDKEAAHDASYDCLMVAKVMNWIFPSDEALANAMESMQTPAEIKVMPFGKHKMKPIYKLPRRYMRYMLTLDLNPDIEFTFKQELDRRPGV